MAAPSTNSTQTNALAKLTEIPAVGSEERDFWLEAAEQHGFNHVFGTGLNHYEASPRAVLTLMSEARLQGQRDVLGAGAIGGEQIVFVIVRTTGEYSDRREDLIAATFDEGAAQRWAEETQRVCQQIAEETNRKTRHTSYEEDEPIHAAAKARCPDPDFDPWGSDAEDVRYGVWRISIGLPAAFATGGAAMAEHAFTCAARCQGTAGGNDPADCDWPVCGCDPYADKVIAALQESGNLLAPTADRGGRQGADQARAIVEAACKPWEFHAGEPPGDDNPLLAVYDAGLTYAFDLLARALGLETFSPSEGSESWEGDVNGTLWNILREARVADPETNEIARAPAPDSHPHSPPRSSPLEDGMTVEQAREVLDQHIPWGHPAFWIDAFRKKSAEVTKAGLRLELIAKASLIETASRTLQAAGEVQE